MMTIKYKHQVKAYTPKNNTPISTEHTIYIMDGSIRYEDVST